MLEDVFAECVAKLEPGGRIAVNVANLGRKPYRSLSADVIGILQDRLGLLLRGEVIWRKARGAGGNCAWGSFKTPANPVLRDLTERIVIASKGRFDRAVGGAGPGDQAGLPSVATATADEFMEATLDLWEMAPESATRVGHPAPFPVELPLRLIDLYTYRGDVVLDPFMGSGTTAVAAVRTGRHYLGYDTDEAYAKAASASASMPRPRPSCSDTEIARPDRASIAARDLLLGAGFSRGGPARHQAAPVRRWPRRRLARHRRGRGRRGWCSWPARAPSCATGLRRSDVLFRTLGEAGVLTGRRPPRAGPHHRPPSRSFGAPRRAPGRTRHPARRRARAGGAGRCRPGSPCTRPVGPPLRSATCCRAAEGQPAHRPCPPPRPRSPRSSRGWRSPARRRCPAALAARPVANVGDDVWARLDGAPRRRPPPRGVRGRVGQRPAPSSRPRRGSEAGTPRLVEWKGPTQAPGDEVVPADLRVDHVWLVSCKYLSKVLANAAPGRLFDRGLAGGPSRTAGDWYGEVAPGAYQDLYAQVRARAGHAGVGPAARGGPHPRAPRRAPRLPRRRLVERGPGGLPASGRGGGAGVGGPLEGRRRQAADAEAVLWRLLRIGSAPVLRPRRASAIAVLRLRVMTPWDWRQAFELKRFDVWGDDAGQPQVRWQAQRPGAGRRARSVSVDGHVEVRWSHGRFGKPPEAKVYLDTPHHLVPGLRAPWRDPRHSRVSDPGGCRTLPAWRGGTTIGSETSWSTRPRPRTVVTGSRFATLAAAALALAPERPGCPRPARAGRRRPRPTAGERRQLTVMFCDVVGLDRAQPAARPRARPRGAAHLPGHVRPGGAPVRGPHRPLHRRRRPRLLRPPRGPRGRCPARGEGRPRPARGAAAGDRGGAEPLRHRPAHPRGGPHGRGRARGHGLRGDAGPGRDRRRHAERRGSPPGPCRARARW